MATAEKGRAMLKLQAQRASKMSLELLLATSAVATAIVLAARFNLSGTLASSELISPAVLINYIKANSEFIDDPSFVLDQTCLEHGLIAYSKFLAAAKGFKMNLVRGKEQELVAGIGEWEAIVRSVRIDPTKLSSFDSLIKRFDAIVGETVVGGTINAKLVRYIDLVRDELFASKNLQPTSLSTFCRDPQVPIDMLMKQAEYLEKLKALEAENEYLKSQSGQFNQPLRDTLRAELKDVHDVLIGLYGSKTTNMSKDQLYLQSS